MGRIMDRGHDGGNTWRWMTLERLVKDNNWTKGAELGVWYGETFKYLVNNCPNLNLFGVDLYAEHLKMMVLRSIFQEKMDTFGNTKNIILT
jgi:hypothetical protein